MGLRLLWAGLGSALAACFIWAGVSVHLRRACVVNDTPYLPLCADSTQLPAPIREQELRLRISRNPGDSGAWIGLAALEYAPNRLGSLRGASALAANEPTVLRLRTAEALDRNDLAAATPLLVQMIILSVSAEAPHILARLVASGQGTALLRPYLSDAKRWLPQVLWALGNLKLPAASALALVSEAAANQALAPAAVQTYLRALKTAGLWADAYGLWATLQGGRVPLLYNAGFEQRFQPDGFDWEVAPVLASRAGAIAVQRDLAKRGRILEVDFSGRSIAVPVIRQYLFVPRGKYTLKGQYNASKLTAEQGLAWTVRCANGGKTEAGRSAAMRDTSGAWQSFQFEFTVPAHCGLVASLELEPFAPFEATSGFKGRAAFDAFELRLSGV